MSNGRRIASAVAIALALAVPACATLAAVTARTASAATAYRYWSYFVANASTGGGWQYAQRGPASQHPVDGEVQGWRFGIQGDGAGASTPRTAPNFGTICTSTPAVAGHIRVGIVLDFGMASDAPPGEQPPAAVVTGCEVVASGATPATGADVLFAAVGAANVRIGTGNDAGLICAIDRYPKTECAPAVTIPTTTASTPPSKTPSPPTAPTPTAAPAQTSTPASTRSRTTPPSTASNPIASSTAAPTGSAPPAGSPAGSLPPVQPVDSVARRQPAHHGVPAATIAGAGLVVVLAGAAVVRGLAGRR